MMMMMMGINGLEPHLKKLFFMSTPLLGTGGGVTQQIHTNRVPKYYTIPSPVFFSIKSVFLIVCSVEHYIYQTESIHSSK